MFTFPINFFKKLTVTTAYRLWTWGVGTTGRLGDGTTTAKSSPVQIGALTDWANVYACDDGGGGIDSANAMWNWGSYPNGDGGGTGTGTYSSPVQVGIVLNGSGSTLAKTGGAQSCGLINAAGVLYMWGNLGAEGGLRTADPQSRPCYIDKAKSFSVTALTPNNSGHIDTSGQLWMIGAGTNGALGDGSTAAKSSPVQIGALTTWTDVGGVLINSNGGTFAAIESGKLYTWGYAGAGSLGNGTTTPNLSSPVQVGANTNWSKVAGGGSQVAVSSSGYFIALKTTGALFSWGNNASGQLGQGNTTSLSSPVQIGALTTWATIAAGANGAAAIKTTGQLFMWGDNTNGQLGQGNTTSVSSPVQVGTLTTWAKVSMSGNYANATDPRCSVVAVKTDGTLWSWGYNGQGQLGQGDTTDRSSPVQVGTLTTWRDAKNFGGTIVATQTGGGVFVWGNCTSGSFGDGTSTANASSPIQLSTSMPTGAKVAASDRRRFYINASGELWAWGLGTSGVHGLNNALDQWGPVRVGALTDWSTVFGAGNHAGAIKTDGTLWRWGAGAGGRLGDGTTTTRSSPVQIGTLTNWATMGLCVSTSAYINTSNQLFTTGLATNGELGNGTTTPNLSSPVQIGTLTNWSKVIGGQSHFLALKTDGTLWSWGLNTNGQLGDASTTTRSSPVQVGTLSSWIAIGTADSSSYGIQSDGTLWTWGAAANGRLANGTTTPDISSPVQVGSLTKWYSLGAANTGGGVAVQRTVTVS